MADSKHLGILEKGVSAWNKWRIDNPDIQPELNDALIKEVDLQGINFCNADLRETNFAQSNLSQSNLAGADLSSSILTQTVLNGADLSGANLSRANLKEALLSQAKLWRTFFNHAHLKKTDLSFAQIEYTDFRNADLTGANFTGANVIRVINTYWNITDAKCDYLFIGRFPCKNRLPADRNYNADEFQKTYRYISLIEINLQSIKWPSDIVLVEWLAAQISRELPNLGLELIRVVRKGVTPKAILTVSNRELYGEAKRLVLHRYQHIVDTMKQNDEHTEALKAEIKEWISQLVPNREDVIWSAPKKTAPVKPALIEFVDELEMFR